MGEGMFDLDEVEDGLGKENYKSADCPIAISSESGNSKQNRNEE
jgi:hypothetical protein